MDGFRIDLRHFWAWLCLTNTPKLSESKYQAGFGVMILGQNPLTFMIPIECTFVLYDNATYNANLFMSEMINSKAGFQTFL